MICGLKVDPSPLEDLAWLLLSLSALPSCSLFFAHDSFASLWEVQSSDPIVTPLHRLPAHSKGPEPGVCVLPSSAWVATPQSLWLVGMGVRHSGSHGTQKGSAKSPSEFNFQSTLQPQRPFWEKQASGLSLKPWSVLKGLVPVCPSSSLVVAFAFLWLSSRSLVRDINGA